MGGLDSTFRGYVIEKLWDVGFKTAHGKINLNGLGRHNICNRCLRGMGVQLEISRGLRSAMFGDPSNGAAHHGGF